MKILLVSMLAIVCSILFAVWLYPTPYAASHAIFLGYGIYASILLVVSTLAFLIKKGISNNKGLQLFVFMLTLVALVLMLKQQYQFYAWKQKVLSTNEITLRTLGQHFVVGYRSFEGVSELVSSGAVGGIYLTVRNIWGKSGSEIHHEIEQLQALRKAAGLPPLIVSADQEGGVVSRLSPPLDKRKSLGEVIKHFAPENQEKMAFEYGVKQGRELSSLGVNLNLSPVVDLMPDKEIPSDRFTKIIRRAISNKPEVVSKMASAYIKGLESAGVQATLKHFPGLGGVTVDTHLNSAHLQTSIEELNGRDWLPFKVITQNTQALIMVGHVHVDAIDSEYPASLSATLLQSVIRKSWHYNGLLITDDLTMGAIYQRENNHLQNTVSQALNAGIDLLLISYDVRQYYPAMAALIEAYQQGELDIQRLNESHQRLNPESSVDRL